MKFLNLISITIGSVVLGSTFGFEVGVGIFFISWGIMPFTPTRVW